MASRGKKGKGVINLQQRPIVIIAALLVLVSGCSTMETRWNDACNKNTVQGYEVFLERYPDSEYSLTATRRIEYLRWQAAKTDSTAKGVENYLKLHPAGAYAREAQEMAESRRWQEATSKDSIFFFQSYLRKHPDGKHSTEARTRLEELEWAAAKKRNRPFDYAYFLRNYPESKFSSQAKAEHRTFAIVVVDFPDKLKSQTSYYNIGGPVWVFQIKFRELNGVDATITSKKMSIHARDGSVWGDFSYVDIIDSSREVEVKIPGGGTGSYTSWVNSPTCTLCGGTMQLDYKGIDANGHSVSTKVQFTLVK